MKTNTIRKFIYMSVNMNVSMNYKKYAYHFCIFLEAFYQTKSHYFENIL